MLNEWLKIRTSKELLKLWESAAAAKKEKFSFWVRSSLEEAANDDLRNLPRRKK